MVDQVNQYITQIKDSLKDYALADIDIDTINPENYPGGPDCKCEGMEMIGIFDPEADGGKGKNRWIPCPCQKFKMERIGNKLALSGGG
jgi:hypothetical protein